LAIEFGREAQWIGSVGIGKQDVRRMSRIDTSREGGAIPAFWHLDDSGTTPSRNIGGPISARIVSNDYLIRQFRVSRESLAHFVDAERQGRRFIQARKENGKHRLGLLVLAHYFQAKPLTTHVQRIHKRIMRKFSPMCSLEKELNVNALAGVFQQSNIKNASQPLVVLVPD